MVAKICRLKVVMFAMVAVQAWGKSQMIGGQCRCAKTIIASNILSGKKRFGRALT
jgi:hypothetical protein